VPPRKSNIKISIVGPGKVGTTLALALKQRGHTVVSVVGRSKPNARRCAGLVSCERYGNRMSDIDPRTNLIIVATPDSAIRSVAEELALSSSLDLRTVTAFHVSGVFTSDALSPLAKRGVLCFSLHPIQTFSETQTPAARVASLKGISYGFEGNDRAQKLARRLVKELGGTLRVVPKERKILYHTACVFASNYLLTAIDAAETIGKELRWKTPGPFGPLIGQTVANARKRGSADVLTGPIARGEVETVKAHLEQLRSRYPELLPLYRALGLRTVEIAERKKPSLRKELSLIRTILIRRR